MAIVFSVYGVFVLLYYAVLIAVKNVYKRYRLESGSDMVITWYGIMGGAIAVFFLVLSFLF